MELEFNEEQNESNVIETKKYSIVFNVDDENKNKNNNENNINIIIENAKIPIIIDAGIGTASEASKAMEWNLFCILIAFSTSPYRPPPL